MSLQLTRISRRKWAAVTAIALGVATCAPGALAGATEAKAAAAASSGKGLNAEQIRTLSDKLALGVTTGGSTAQRYAARAAAAAPEAAGATAESAPATSPNSLNNLNSPNSESSADAASATPPNAVVTQTDNIETPSGLSLTGTIPGSADWYRVDTSGQVARMNASGAPVWTKTERAMTADWGLKGTLWFAQNPPQLVMNAGYNPVSPAAESSNSTYAVGDFGGDSGGQDIAVAYTVGTNGYFTFTADGTKLTGEASFVEVLSGRDGHRLWSKAYPGAVTQLVTAAGGSGTGLVIGDETGPAWDTNPVPEQGDSRSTLSYLTFAPGGAATTRWSFSRDVPWARWLSVIPAAGGIAASWSDTPLGLGSPRPADGHVVLLDTTTGKAKFDVETPDYPRILIDDPSHGRILAGEEVDPADTVAWRLTGYAPATGKRTVLSTTPNQFLTTLGVGDGGGKDASYYATAVAIDGEYISGSVVSGLNADGRAMWSAAVPAAYNGDVPIVGGAALAPAHHETLVVTTQDPRQPTESDPMGPYEGQIMALDSRSGAVRWQHSGVVATGLVPALSGDTIESVAADDTMYAYNAATGTTKTVQGRPANRRGGVRHRGRPAGNVDGSRRHLAGRPDLGRDPGRHRHSAGHRRQAAPGSRRRLGVQRRVLPRLGPDRRHHRQQWTLPGGGMLGRARLRHGDRPGQPRARRRQGPRREVGNGGRGEPGPQPNRLRPRAISRR